MRQIRIVPIALALAACNQGGATEPKPPIAWSKLADGSSYMIEPDRGPDAAVRTAIRCWPQDPGYDCLEVTWMGRMGYAAVRFTVASLPARLPVDMPANGYSCSFSPDHLMLSEEIRSPTAKLASNDALPGAGKPWTRAWVEGFMRDNKVGGTPYFDCDPVMDLLFQGSLETVGTTAISRAQLR